jgi:hypothetical protein
MQLFTGSSTTFISRQFSVIGSQYRTPGNNIAPGRFAFEAQK